MNEIITKNAEDGTLIKFEKCCEIRDFQAFQSPTSYIRGQKRGMITKYLYSMKHCPALLTSVSHADRFLL